MIIKPNAAPAAAVSAAAAGILQACTMQEHEDVTHDMLSQDVAWDAPPIIIRDAVADIAAAANAAGPYNAGA